MDFNHIEDHIRMINSVGFTLNIDQKIKLELSINKLNQTYPDIEQFKFWGRIQTLTKSYYIILGLKYTGCYEFPHKTFYWSSNNFNFTKLPEIFIQHKDVVNKFKSILSGDPNKILVPFEGQNNQQQPPQAEQGGQVQGSPQKKKLEDDDEAVELPKKNFTELNRLSFIVRSIENECQVIPVGAYKMTPNHELHPNYNFYGLKQNEASDLSKWQHFRAPQSEHKKKQIQNQNVIFKFDILDQISPDLPKGCWSVQNDTTKLIYSVRNLIWQGYYAYHKVNTSIYGSIYVGDGIKNVDLPFLL